MRLPSPYSMCTRHKFFGAAGITDVRSHSELTSLMGKITPDKGFSTNRLTEDDDKRNVNAQVVCDTISLSFSF